MNLIPLEKLNELRFQAAPRPPDELQRWCRNGDLPAKKIGRKWFVDLDAFDRGEHGTREKQQFSPAAIAVLDKIRTHRRH